MESKLQESPMEIRPFIFKVTGDEEYIQDILTDIDRDLTDTFLTQITDDYGADPDLIQVQMLLGERISILLVSSDMTMEEKEEFASYIADRILQAYGPIDSELIATLEESPKLEESRIHRILATSDTYQDDNGNYIIIYDVNDNNVTYTENGKEGTQTDTMDNLNKRIIDNGYEKLNESEIKEEGIFNKKDKVKPVEIFDKEDAKSYLKDIALPITNTIMKNKDAISFELPDKGEIHNNLINYTIKILDSKGVDLISIGEQIANNLKDTPIYRGKIEDIKCIPEGNNLILSLIGPKDIIEGDATIVESKIEEDKNMNGTDYAVEAIKSFYENGELDTEWLENELELTLMNNESLTKGVYNTRRPAHSPAFEALVVVLNQRSDMALTGKQVQAGFKALGLDFKEVLKPTVEYVLEQREEAKDETKTESIKDTTETKTPAEEIEDMLNRTRNREEVVGIEESKELAESFVDKLYIKPDEDGRYVIAHKDYDNIEVYSEGSGVKKIWKVYLNSEPSVHYTTDEFAEKDLKALKTALETDSENTIISECKEVKDESVEVLEEARDRVAETLPRFIYNLTQSDFDTYGETAWSGNEPQNQGGVKVYPVFKNGKSDITMEQIEEAVLKEFPELRVWGHSGANDIYFTRKEQKTEDIEQTEIEEDKTILDLLQERIGQEISVGEFNTLLQSIFGRYNDIFLMVSDIYNVDPADLHEVVVFDDEDMYTITYEIKDQIDAIIAITDVTVE